jgi:serine/threonine-protein kinase RsbW
VSTNEAEAVVELTIPGKPEYVGVVRLAILGVASRMRFSYDAIEDIRLAVGEACTTAIERANGAGGASDIRVRCVIDPEKLTVEVCDHTPAAAEPAPMAEGGLDERTLGGVLIRILMDDVTTEQENGVRVVRMVKYVANLTR